VIVSLPSDVNSIVVFRVAPVCVTVPCHLPTMVGLAAQPARAQGSKASAKRGTGRRAGDRVFIRKSPPPWNSMGVFFLFVV